MTAPSQIIADSVATFLAFAISRPDLEFLVTPVGCGLAGYRQEQIKPLFESYGPLPTNCEYSKEWTI